jgi:uncharacterized SAM-binding protein YcdF (DUF218 family)
VDIILHLGGNSERAQTAAALARDLPNAKIVVSTESGDYMRYYKDADIDPVRIISNRAAWDTVTNFTHTYKLLKALDCTRLYVVTDMFHCYRSMLIAICIWGKRVPIYIVPHGTSVSPSDESFAAFDCFRALLWRLTGILIYWKSVYEERKPYFEPEKGHSWIEIGI